MTELSTQTTPQMARPMAVYVHWPFCRKKCPYCDFNSHVRAQVDHAAWRDALLTELRYWRERVQGDAISSIFFGGGTPSLMEPETVAAIIAEVYQLWPGTVRETNAPAKEMLEITLEANPTSVEAAKFKALHDAGVNRVSLGVQSLQAASLAFLGREHSADEALNAVALAAATFPRYSFDLIYALPGQTLRDWETELREALSFARGHLSLYQLTIEENTAFHHQYHVQQAFALPREELAADLFALTQSVMEGAGLPSYEISNHAAPGQESRHNLSYWRSQGYLGIGPGAHGRVDLGAERCATRTFKSPERWLEQVQKLGHGLEEEIPLTAEERFEERVLMGLRLTREGINLQHFDPAARTQLLQRAQMPLREGLMHHTGDRLQVTSKGWPVLNALTTALLLQR